MMQLPARAGYDKRQAAGSGASEMSMDDMELEDGLFGQAEQKEVSGQCTLVLREFALVEGLESGVGLDLKFEVVAPVEFVGEWINARIWPHRSGKPVIAYSAKDGEPNAFARIQLAMDNRKQLGAGEKADLKRWIAEGRKVTAFIYSQASKSNGKLYPRIEYRTLAPAK